MQNGGGLKTKNILQEFFEIKLDKLDVQMCALLPKKYFYDQNNSHFMKIALTFPPLVSTAL